MPEMLSPAILNKSMPSRGGATIGTPPARAASGAFQREVPFRDEERNLQCSGEVYQIENGILQSMTWKALRIRGREE